MTRKYRKKPKNRSPLPEQVVHMAKALEVVDRTETRNGYIPAFHIWEQVGVPETTMRVLLAYLTKAGILRGKQGPMGGYKRLRQATVAELCGLVTPRWDIEDIMAWGDYLAPFHVVIKSAGKLQV